MTALLSPTPVQKFFDNNGAPAAGFSLYTYTAGTSTAAPTYVDATQVTQNPNPIILNARGECNLWIPPNVAYKFALQDSLGNGIWSVDQVINSQLLTLYGGVDTGSANAYILNYTANFQTLVDGIVLYFKAANTNTTTSTLNVNGLGVVNILQQTGALLQPGMIGANTIIEVIYIGGNFYLISSAYTIPQASNFLMIPAGFNPALGSVTVSYVAANNTVALTLPVFSGTSNNIQFTLSGLPITLQPASNQTVNIVGPVQDNGGFLTTGVALITPGSGTIQLSPSAGGNWTASGVKGVGQITTRPFPLPPLVSFATITYPLSP